MVKFNDNAATLSPPQANMGPSTPLRRASTAASSVAGDSTPGSPLSARSRLQTLAIETLLSSTMASVSATPPRLPVAKNKEPLSLPTTTRNFRGFVQKSGPIFYFQDAVEATLAWDDWAWTSMWMGVWAVVALQPYLLLCAPTAILAIILIRTHMARFPVGRRADGTAAPGSKAHLSSSGKPGGAGEELVTPTPSEALEHAIQYPTSTGHGAVRPPIMPNPPHEGTIKYYENLRDIQNMMKMVTDGYDAIAPAVPFLNWSSYRRTLLLFQASMILTVVMFFFGPFIPIRPILLLVGEGAFIANHPWVKPAVLGLTKTLQEEKTACKTPLGRTLYQLEVKNREQMAALRQWYEEDGLDDTVWEKGWRDVEMYQNERFADANAASGTGWSAHNLRFGERKAFTKGSDGWTAQELDVAGYSLDIRQVAMALEPGWAWVEGDDWRIDWVGQWSNVGVDAEGFVYTDSDWQAASPFAYGHAGQPRYPPTLRSDGKYGFSLGELLRKPSEGEGSVFEDDDEDDAADLSLTGMEIRGAKAETRRRRWLRRAVWVGKSDLVQEG